MKWLKNLFEMKGGKAEKTSVVEYSGLSDFLLHASPEKKIAVFTEAARRANEDQRKTFERATPSLSR
jgi:hypothetical protein